MRALAGLIKLVGSVQGAAVARTGFPDGYPGRPVGLLSPRLLRLRECRASWSLNIFESILALSEYLMFEAFARGDVMHRIGIGRFWPIFPAGIYETKKGWLGVTTITSTHWRVFCDMLDLTELRDDPVLILGEDRLRQMERIVRRIMPKLTMRTAQSWFADGLKRKIPIVR